jgi:hypothetical protein
MIEAVNIPNDLNSMMNWNNAAAVAVAAAVDGGDDDDDDDDSHVNGHDNVDNDNCHQQIDVHIYNDKILSIDLY